MAKAKTAAKTKAKAAPKSNDQKAMALLKKLVKAIDESTYNDLCSSGQAIINEAAKLTGEKAAFCQRIITFFDLANDVEIDDHLDDDEYSAEVVIVNKRTKKRYTSTHSYADYEVSGY